MKYGNVEFGQVEALLNIIGGTKALRAILCGDARVTVEFLPYMSHVTSHTLEPTKGDVTFEAAKAIFSGFDWSPSDWDYRNTESQEVEVIKWERRGSNLATLFNSLGEMRSLCLSLGQIVEFCCSHRESLFDQTGFPCEINDKLFVVAVQRVFKTLKIRFVIPDCSFSSKHRGVVVRKK